VRVRVSILGPLEVHDEHGRIDVRGARLRSLLARLALDAGRVVSVDALALSLWEDDVPTDVANALQSLVSRLRRALPDPELIRSRDGGYALAVSRDDVDAHRFQAWALEGRDALRADDPATAAHLLTRALSLWRGEALADLRESPYAAPAVALLDQARTAAVEDRLDAEVRLGRGPDVLPELLSLVEDEPLRERSVGLLMRALCDAGRQAEALDQFERTRRLLADRLGTDPSASLQAVHLDVLRGGADPAVERPATNLRSTLTSFLGRDDELDRLDGLLATHRLVTLVGPGGAGKTRLALEAAARQRGYGAVWVAELAPVTSPDDIAQAILDVIDVRDVPILESRRLRPARDALTQLEDALSSGTCLLVLDNCEHLVDSAAALSARLLERCPRLRILATSREPLSITGEVLHPVSMLALPREGAGVDEAAQSSAVQLFLERAAAVAPGFHLTENDVAHVVEVCRRLDGLPLAIELAAARLRSMSVSQLAGRLDDRFRLLTGGSRTAVARHRTLRAVVEWSWDLLSADERQVAERFAVFPGGATADAVARVCLGPGSSTDDAEDALAALADKSLVQLVAADTGAEPRYRMLETLREFGSERLAADGELLATRRLHAQYFLEMAERTEPQLRTHTQLAALHAFDAEHDNLLAALRFAADDGDADTAVRIAGGIGWYWILMDSHAEAAAWSRTALDTPGDADLHARALVTGLHAVNAVASGLIDLGDEASLKGLLDEVPVVDATRGHPLLSLLPPARRLLEEDFEGFEAECARALTNPDPWAHAAIHMLRVQVCENVGDIVGTRLNVDRAIELFRATGDRWGVAVSLTSLGELLLLQQDDLGALAAHEEAYLLTTELLPRSRDNADALMHLALVRARLGEREEAFALLTRARAGAEAAGSRHHLAMIDVSLANLARHDGDLVAARAAVDSAEARLGHSAILVPQLEAMVHVARALLEVADGQLDPVPDLLATSYRLARASRDAPIAAWVAVAAAAWLRATGDAEAAASMLGTGNALRGASDDGNPDVVAVARWCAAELGEAEFSAAVAAAAAATHSEALPILGDAVGVVDEVHPFSVARARA
jgi:predicted ATPase/DNA-binding SARP family transcriptional activator